MRELMHENGGEPIVVVVKCRVVERRVGVEVDRIIGDRGAEPVC